MSIHEMRMEYGAALNIIKTLLDGMIENEQELTQGQIYAFEQSLRAAREAVELVHFDGVWNGRLTRPPNNPVTFPVRRDF